MHRVVSIVRGRPVICFYLLTCAITWGSFYGARLLFPESVSAFLTQNIFPKGLPLAFSLAGILGSYGPSLAGLTVTALCSGRPGVREWLARWTRWRASWKWYAAAFPSAPVLFVMQHLITHPAKGFDRLFLSSSSAELRDAFVGFFLMVALYFPYIAGEEGGWRGFALPRLQVRYGPIWASCIVAPMWLAWHGPALFYHLGTLAVSLALLRDLLVITLFSLVCTWIFNSAEGCLLPVILWHATTDAMADTERRFFPPLGDLAPGHAVGDWILWPIAAIILIWFTRGRLGYTNPEKEANRALEPMPASFTPPAAQESRRL